jgi:hypothetical protein
MNMEQWWNYIGRGKPKNSEKTCPSATLSTTNPTMIDPGLRGDMPATNHLRHATAPEIRDFSLILLNYIRTMIFALGTLSGR